MIRILLVADYCIDIWIRGDATRVSPEAACLVFVPDPSETIQNPGMGGNVLTNLKSLAPDIEVEAIFPENDNRKIRHVDKRSNQHLLRVDEETLVGPLNFAIFSSRVSRNSYDACVISDYAKGFLDTTIMGQIVEYCHARDIPTFVDTKSILGPWSRNATFVKINQFEYKTQLAAFCSPWKECRNLIVTLGKDGMALYDESGSVIYSTPIAESKVFDVSGAGDSVLAALVVRYLRSNDIKDAMDYANKVGALAVSKRGVSVIKASEVI